MTKAAARTALAVLAAVALSSARPALADHDSNVEIQFWAFSRDSQHILVIIKDEARGDRLAIKQIAKQASVYEMPLPEGIAPEQLPYYLQFPPFNAYGFVDPGTVGETSPDGFLLLSAAMPGKLQLMLSQGEKMTQLFGIPLGRDMTSQQMATATLKEVRWASTGKCVALIVHQKMDASYGLAVDQLVSFDPTTFKAKVAAPAAPPAGAPRK